LEGLVVLQLESSRGALFRTQAAGDALERLGLRVGIEEHVCGGAKTYAHETGSAFFIVHPDYAVFISVKGFHGTDIDTCSALIAYADVR